MRENTIKRRRAPKKLVPAKESEDEMREKRRKKKRLNKKIQRKVEAKMCWFQRFKRCCKH